MKIIDFRAKGISPGVLSKVFLIGMLASAWIAQAAGLGKLTVSSYIGQPLNAEIALESVTDKEIDSLSARLASPKTFQKTGVNLAHYHAMLSVSVEKRTDGRPYIRISSSQAINEPFLNLLIELSSSSGHLLREYNVLLDPAETQKTASAEPVVQQDRDKTGSSAATAGKTQLSVETPPPLPAQARGIYGPVIRGDTLSRIARQVSPDSVNLNQMLVALYRANRDAFLERNMNLLKVGVILRIPDESEISSVTTKEASREIAVQKENWNDYRQRIADLADNSSEKFNLKQSQTGKITTVSGESSIIGSNKHEEVLILSKGELLSDNHLLAKKAEDRTAQNYLYMMEEDAIAKERALQEANERVAILEQNVAKLQRLLELKGSTPEGKSGIEPDHTQHIPDLQAILAPTKQVDIAVVRDSIEAPGSVVGVSENSTSPITIPAQSVKSASLSEPLQPVSPESSESDLMDTLLQYVDKNSKWAAAGLGVLLVIALSASLILRKRKQFGDPNSSDIYDYAEKDNELMSSGLTKITSVDAEHIEKPDKELIQRTVTTSESGDSGLTDTAGNQTNVDPGLFFGGQQDEKATEPLFFTADSISPTYAENEIALDESNALDNEIRTSMIEPDQAEYQKRALIDAEEDVERKEDEISEQWILTSDDDTLERKSDLVQAQDDSEARASSHTAEHQIDFDLKLPEETKLARDSHMMDGLPELNSSLANIDLDLGDEPGEKPQAVDESSEVSMDMQWREVATKLDLAKAYLEMDDNEGARDILEEVLREGDHEQQSAARFMLDKIS